MSIDPTTRITRALERFSRRSARRGLPTPQVCIRSPRLEFAYGDAAMPFAGASIGKLLTAALVMQLAEAGDWSPSTSIADVLPADELHGLFVRRGSDRMHAVTLEHLLAHRSGLRDVFEDRMPGGDSLRVRLLRDLDRRWTPAESLDAARGAELRSEPGAA